MKTRYTSLVNVKKNIVQKSERTLQLANANLKNAQKALASSFNSLGDITSPQEGQISDLLSSRMLFDAQRNEIKHNEEWVDFAKHEIRKAKEELKYNMIEYEKFTYLEIEEIKRIIKEQQIAEAKELDEIALLTFSNKKNKETF